MAILLTPRARRVVRERARGEAALLGHTLVGTDHLLLGIFLEGPSMACAALTALGVNADRLRSAVESLPRPGASPAPLHGMVLGRDSDRAIRFASDEARATGRRHAGVVHLLLGIARDPACAGARVLAGFGADYARVRRAAIDQLAAEPATPAATGQDSPERLAARRRRPDNRFTERARTICGLAREEARRLGHATAGPGHLLLGVVLEGEGIGATVLGRLDIDPGELRARLERALGAPDEPGAGDPLPALAADSRAVIDAAIEEAADIGHYYVGSEHLLIALARESSGVPAAVLLSLGVTPGRARKEVLRLLGGG